MNNRKIEEYKILNKMLNDVSYKEDLLEVLYGREKRVFGFISNNKGEDLLDKHFKFNTYYKTIIDCNKKIKYSFEKALDLTYNSDILNDYKMFSVNKNEFEIFYYIENAVFTLWDLLAQLYNVKYGFEISSRYVEYNKIFRHTTIDKDNCKIRYSTKDRKYKILNIESSDVENLDKIKHYIEEKNNISDDSYWTGNHKYMNDYRNMMTHRNSPNISDLGPVGITLKDSPNFVLKRLLEEYVNISRFIITYIEKIYYIISF